MDRDQVDEVLTQFEATTSSITGIEKKMEKVSQYMDTVQVQRRALVVHAEVTTSLIDGLGESVADQSKMIYDYFSTSFEHFAGLVEILETSLYNLKLEDAPRQIQREFGPLLMPAVVLVVIITVSNCYFGFMLASDESLAEALGDGFFIGGNTTADHAAEGEARHSEMNILFLFAVGHVVLIGLAIVYIAVDLLRRRLKQRRRSRRSLAGPLFFPTEDSDSVDSETEAFQTEDSGEDQPEVQQPRDRGSTTSAVSDGSLRLSSASRLTRRNSERKSGTPISGLLRRVQHAALIRDTVVSNDSEDKFKSIFGLGSAVSKSKGSQEWLGLCRIKDSQVAVRVAATSSSTVIGTLVHGKRVMVQQAFRGGKGKIWGRISSPIAGWVLLADANTGYKAVAKVKESPSPVQEVARSSRPSGESGKTMSSALRSMVSWEKLSEKANS